MSHSDSTQLPPLPLPSGIISRYITSSASDLHYHYLEAGRKGDPLLLLLHGFPELAYTWRKVIPSLAESGYYVVAPDQRGVGRTTGWDTSSFGNVDMNTFSMTNIVRDAVVLVNALGYNKVHCVVGHDFGAQVASVACMARPDLFGRLITLSSPIGFTRSLPFDVVSAEQQEKPSYDLNRQLSLLKEPRKYYQMYYSTADASPEMSPRKGLKEFLHGYVYLKSANWPGNKPHPLKGAIAEEFAKMPFYYVMPLNNGMREAVTAQLQEPLGVLPWLPDLELATWAEEFARTGFQGGLNWYRARTDPKYSKDLDLFAGRKIEVPCLVIQGRQDWSTFQQPGVIDRLPEYCTQFKGLRIVEGAGHWIEQEMPQRVVKEILGHCKVSL